MWLYISDGFLSIVAHRDLPMHLLVRARHPEHIQDLLTIHFVQSFIEPLSNAPWQVT
jgi:hypothetical protein